MKVLFPPVKTSVLFLRSSYWVMMPLGMAGSTHVTLRAVALTAVACGGDVNSGSDSNVVMIPLLETHPAELQASTVTAYSVKGLRLVMVRDSTVVSLTATLIRAGRIARE